jgi:uncharacterized protein with HEPN domain
MRNKLIHEYFEVKQKVVLGDCGKRVSLIKNTL